MKSHKTVQLLAYDFDCLPGHIKIEGRGHGASLRVAVIRAVDAVFSDPRLKRKQISDFKMSAVVISDKPPILPDSQ